MGIIIKEFIPSKATDDEFERLFNLRDVVFREQEPDDPPFPRNLWKGWMLNPNPNFKIYYWLALNTENSDLILGYVQGAFSSPSDPSYDANKHLAFGNLEVHPDFRRIGIANKLLRTLLVKSNAWDTKINTLQFSAVLNAGHTFAKQHNGTLALETAENRLRMDEVNWKMMREWSEEGPKRAPGVTIQSFEDIPEEILSEYVDIYSETMNKQPLGEMEGRYIVTPETRREQERRFAEQNIRCYTKISKESDGRISGLTEIFYLPDRDHRIGQGLTGVKEEYQGRGLGKWLKSEMLLEIKKTYPDAVYIATRNADANTPMLSINNRMGFKRHRAISMYKFDIEELKKVVWAVTEQKRTLRIRI